MNRSAVIGVLFLLLVPMSVVAQTCAELTFEVANRSDLEALTGERFEDDYSDSAYDPNENGLGMFSDEEMTAVKNEISYRVHAGGLNIVFNQSFCGGCNYGFQLTFTGMSLADERGGFLGFGMDIVELFDFPYVATVWFYDFTFVDFPLPEEVLGGNVFWGVFSECSIISINFGDVAGGEVNNEGSLRVDDVFLGVDPQPIFSDGFESGDTSLWQ